MRVISAPAIAALQSKAFAVRVLVKMSPVGSPPLCVWDDVGEITSGGDTYVGIAGRFVCKATSSAKDLSIRNIEITFSGLDATVVGMLSGVQWHQSPIAVQRAILAVDSPQTLMLTPEFSGFMDQFEWTEGGQGEPSSLVLRCESISREFGRNGSRTSSDADQRERDASDGLFAFAASAVSKNINWGRQPQQAQKMASGVIGFLQKVL